MGNLCSKRKNSDSQSVHSDGSPSGRRRQDSAEALENHAAGSKRPSQQNGTSQGVTGPEAGPGCSLQKDVLRGQMRKEEPSSVSGDSMSSPTALAPSYVSSSKESFTPPLEIRKQSDNVKNLLSGKVAKTKPMQKCRKITLYVCTSYSQDFRLEKGQLHTEVYPKLRDYCSNRGYELHVTDLHWKTELEGRDDFPELCLGELKRQLEVSYVIPVLFLSNSLGPTLLPKTVEQQDFEMAVKNVGDAESKNLLEKWYSLDTQSQPPCYRVKPIATHLPKITSEKEEEKSCAISEWHQISEQILAVMLRIFPTELRDTYLTSVIEQEIHNCIFMSREVAKRSIWTQRVFTHIQTQSSLSATEVEKNRRLEALQNELKNQLSADHILRLLVKWQEGGLSREHPEHVQYLQEVSKQLTSQLQSILNELIEEDQTKAVWKSCYGVDGSLCSELMQQTVFCQQAAKCSPSVENVLNQIKNHIGNTDVHPLVLYGPKGCGKSCFLSRVIQQCSTWYPDALIIFRFVGLTPESRSLVQLLRTITSQLCFLLTGRNYWIPHNVQSYQRELYKLLSSMTSHPLVLIVADGLDELNPFEASSLNWLSEALPSKMRVIISCADGSSVFQTLKANLPHESAFIPMTPLTQQAASGLLTASILQYNHSVDPEVQKKLSAGLKNCTLPLFIKVLAWQASVDTQGLIDVSGIKDLNSAIHGLFDYIEKTLGKEKVEKTLELICTSRYGLCDSELLDLLAHLQTFSTNSTFLDWAPASLFLAQLHQRLGPFLEWGVAGDAVVVRFRDSALYDLAKARYTSNNERAHKNLLDYFQGALKGIKKGRQIDYASTTRAGNRHHRRRLEEVPLHQYHLHGSIKNTLLCNIDWLLDKIRSSTVYNVIEDITMELKGDFTKDPDLSLLCQTLSASASALSYDGQQFFGQIFGRLQNIFASPTDDSSSPLPTNPLWTPEKCPFMKSLFEASQNPRVPSFLPISSLLNCPTDHQSEVIDYAQMDKGATYFSELTRMKVSNQFVVSLSTAKEEVIVWDVYTEKPVRTLKGVLNPQSLRIIDERQCVVLCGRELHIFNLDDGTFVTKLKGVMNQKMPYFGLHDANHIVALSRNRMYVNLMNLESGDCVTTFKVGEDRFLNSLIVSENGTILVCGDETQKPFPLLVWDLTSRKLLYDLRIPHHEFITNLSAITKEGHFVCCVCREVDDTGPNFIVVYDLQSGTLFKKWKPGFSTQAIAISAQGGCVINALEDNRILVWDLVTGTCQWSLQKHTAPVDILRLDQKGARCLSCDSTGRDRTTCLWDLTNGTLLALFTPDISFTACEVSNDGDGVILGLRGSTSVVTLLYRDNVSIYSNRVQEKFGDESNNGKVSDLKNK